MLLSKAHARGSFKLDKWGSKQHPDCISRKIEAVIKAGGCGSTTRCISTGETALMLAARVEVSASLSVQKKFYDRLVHMYSCYIGLAQPLLERDLDDNTAAHHAAFNSNELLLSALKSAEPGMLRVQDQRNKTPLSLAAYENYVPCMQSLLAAAEGDNDVEAVALIRDDYGSTPLQNAIKGFASREDGRNNDVLPLARLLVETWRRSPLVFKASLGLIRDRFAAAAIVRSEGGGGGCDPHPRGM